jgi:predicted transcriptional regulator
MGRPKKDGRDLNCFLRRDLFEQLEQYCDEMGQTKTMVIERALEKTFREHEKNKKKNKN